MHSLRPDQTPPDQCPPANGAIFQQYKVHGWEFWLFIVGLGLYLFTRFIALDKFPIYFFTDEAIQTMSAVDLIAQGLRNANGNLFPVYFENGGQFNLSLSVYLQLLPALLPRSVWLTRGIAALVTLVVPLSVGIALKNFFKIRTWWLAPVLLSAIPCWFLHSRTAFETSLGASMFSLFLYFYLDYRLANRRRLPLALLFGALALYSYSPMQMVVVITGLLFLIIDFRYHLADRKGLREGFAILLILALPYFLFRFNNPEALSQHLRMLQSYWIGDQPVISKLGAFLSRYVRAFDPTYWFLPNQVDLIRHQMKGMGHLPLFSLPLVLVGLVLTFKNLRKPAWRVVLVALLAVPTGAALVDVAITRLLAMVVPVVFLACLGLDALIHWLAGLLHHEKTLSLATFGLLAAFSLWMTNTAIQNGPTWYENYGLYGMQWGGKTLFDEVTAFQETHPDKQVFLSPSWANGTDVIARFFLGDPLPIQMGTIEPFTLYQLPLDEDMVFVMIPEEYTWMQTTGKFQDVQVLETLSYPNGKPGFYFVSLRYVDNIEAIIEQDLAERRQSKTANLTLLGQEVQVEYSPLDVNDIYQAFDGDEATLIRTFEANPLVISIHFSQPVELNQITALVGNTPSWLQVEIISPGEETPIIFTEEAEASDEIHPLTVTLDSNRLVQTLIVSLENINENEPTHVHLWELIIK